MRRFWVCLGMSVVLGGLNVIAWEFLPAQWRAIANGFLFAFACWGCYIAGEGGK